jgi:hypothetical protein
MLKATLLTFWRLRLLTIRRIGRNWHPLFIDAGYSSTGFRHRCNPNPAPLFIDGLGGRVYIPYVYDRACYYQR